MEKNRGVTIWQVRTFALNKERYVRMYKYLSTLSVLKSIIFYALTYLNYIQYIVWIYCTWLFILHIVFLVVINIPLFHAWSVVFSSWIILILCGILSSPFFSAQLGFTIMSVISIWILDSDFFSIYGQLVHPLHGRRVVFRSYRGQCSLIFHWSKITVPISNLMFI